MPDAGVLCPTGPNGEHLLAHQAFPHDWFCRRCQAVLHLGVWMRKQEPEPLVADGTSDER